MVGAGASHAIQHFTFKDAQYTADSGATLALKYDVSDVRFPVVSVFRMWPQCGRGWLATRGGTFRLPAGYAEKNTV